MPAQGLAVGVTWRKDKCSSPFTQNLGLSLGFCRPPCRVDLAGLQGACDHLSSRPTWTLASPSLLPGSPIWLLLRARDSYILG